MNEQLRKQLATAAEVAKGREQPTVSVHSKAIINLGGESLLTEHDRFHPDSIAAVDTSELLKLCGDAIDINANTTPIVETTTDDFT